uniref:keratin-associated protein 15-1-like n=1 Tax=Arvicanthis niloticus TaxID=61156 RepID=UPI001486762E|nr:keratin-associated protein 15-1-like [Arvicanthis niloticus]
MSYICNSGNFSSHSFGSFLRQPVSTYNSFYPTGNVGNVVYSPKNFQLGSSFYNGQQETFSEPLEGHLPCAGDCILPDILLRPRHYFSKPVPGRLHWVFWIWQLRLWIFWFGSSGVRSHGLDVTSSAQATSLLRVSSHLITSQAIALAFAGQICEHPKCLMKVSLP